MNTHDEDIDLPDLLNRVADWIRFTVPEGTTSRKFWEDRLRQAAVEAYRQRMGEPVAWIVPDFGFLFPSRDAADRYLSNVGDARKPTPVYAAPQPADPTKADFEEAAETCRSMGADTFAKCFEEAAQPVEPVVMKEICPECNHQFECFHNGYINQLKAVSAEPVNKDASSVANLPLPEEVKEAITEVAGEDWWFCDETVPLAAARAIRKLRVEQESFTGSKSGVDELLKHLKAAHALIENTEAFGRTASRGILQCGDATWNIDESKAAIADYEAQDQVPASDVGPQPHGPPVTEQEEEAWQQMEKRKS